MKFCAPPVLFSLLFVFAISAKAEGIASMTSVTAKNFKTLPFHKLSIDCRTQRGKTFVDLSVRADEAHPFSSCSVTIYDESGEEIIAQFDPIDRQALKKEGLPKGRRVYFHVAEELLENVRVMYHLSADGFTSHVFTITGDQLKKLSGV